MSNNQEKERLYQVKVRTVPSVVYRCVSCLRKFIKTRGKDQESCLFCLRTSNHDIRK